MRAQLAVALTLLTAAAADAQSNPFRPVPVRSCPYADSRLGPLGDDATVTMYGFYDKQRDTSYFVTGIGDPKTPVIRSSTKYRGTGPVREPAIQVATFFFGRDAQVLAEISRNGPVQTVFLLNDSVTLYPRSTAQGLFESGSTTLTPSVSALLEGEDAFKVVAAPKGIMRFGLVSNAVTDLIRREIRALIRVAVCPQ